MKNQKNLHLKYTFCETAANPTHFQPNLGQIKSVFLHLRSWCSQTSMCFLLQQCNDHRKLQLSSCIMTPHKKMWETHVRHQIPSAINNKQLNYSVHVEKHIHKTLCLLHLSSYYQLQPQNCTSSRFQLSIDARAPIPRSSVRRRRLL